MKRLVSASLALLLYCSLGWMPVAVLHAAVAFVNSVQAGGTGGADVTTGAIDTTSGSINLIVAHVADCGVCGPSTSVTDGVANVYTACGAQSTSGAGTRSGLFYKANPTTSATHTFSTNSGAGTYPSIQVLTFSGASGTPCDSGHTNGGTAVAGTIQPGSVTPSSTAVAVAGVVWDTDAAITVSVDSGFSTPVQTAFSSGNHFAGGISYKLAVSVAVNPTFTFSSNTPNAAARSSPFLEAAAVSTRGVILGGGVF